jgi:(2R)-sulfolactate sulfo-lyase subunit alpha
MWATVRRQITTEREQRMADTDFLAHLGVDTVAIAVRDVEPGPRRVTFLDETAAVTLGVAAKISLGHKVALQDVASGEEIVEYGVGIGRATSTIRIGDWVHVHNLKGVRWV